MLDLYLKLTWRNLKKRKFYSFVMLVGLAVSMSFALLIGSYIYSEFEVNQDLEDLERQYLLTSNWEKPNMGLELTTPAPLGNALKESYPHLVENAYSYDAINAFVKKDNEVYRESLQLGDPDVLSMYGFDLLHGNSETALSDPFNLVISKEMAIKYFGHTDVVNEELEIESFSGQRRSFSIGGVLGDVPYNSITHLVFKDIPILMNKEALRFFGRYDIVSNWNNVYMVNYVQLTETANPKELKEPIEDLIRSHSSPSIHENIHVVPSPLKSIYLTMNDHFVERNVRTLTWITLFILLMAMINYVNITVGNMSERLKEMGVRKTLGGRRRGIGVQLMLESLFLSLVSLVIAFAIYQVVHPHFSSILGKELMALSNFPIDLSIYAISFALVVGIASGIYPSVVFPSLDITDSLQGVSHDFKGHKMIGNGLMYVQFVVSLFILGYAFVASNQIGYLFEKELGYSKDNIAYAVTPRNWTEQGVNQMKMVRNELAKVKGVNSTSLAYEIPDGNVGFQNGVFRRGQDSSSAVYSMILQTDENYLETYQIPLLSGRFFNSSYSRIGGNPQIVINLSTAEALGFSSASDAINQWIRIQGFDGDHQVIGVINDFHFAAMYEPIKPIVIKNLSDLSNYRYLTFKFNDDLSGEVIGALESKWKELLPDAPFEYHFLDTTLENLYQADLRLKTATHVASILSLIIVLMGIVGLVSIRIIRRTKEMGIRKVLGAHIVHLKFLLLKEFLVMSGLAAVVAIPFIYFIGQNWLSNFAYRIDINVIPLLAIVLAFVVLIYIVTAIQAYKFLRVNPAESLRTE